MTYCIATAAGVELFTSPWAAGSRAASYFGPIVSERVIHRRLLAREAVLEAEEGALFDDLGRRAAELGANAVVGLEVELDPFDGQSVRLRAVGTAARLEPLW